MCHNVSTVHVINDICQNHNTTIQTQQGNKTQFWSNWFDTQWHNSFSKLGRIREIYEVSDYKNSPRPSILATGWSKRRSDEEGLW